MKIEFIPISKETEISVAAPRPAKQYIPNWYKNVSRFKEGAGPIIKNGQVENNTIKACYPFYDSMTAGYIQETWCDISINFNQNGSFEYNYANSPQIISHRDESNIPISSNFHDVEFLWQIQWMPRVPRGWSVLFCQPMNRMNLPFYSLSGIIDSDLFYYAREGKYPFYLKKEFKNIIIPAGTPMFQMIPIKRENWKSSFTNFNETEMLKNISRYEKYFIGRYKKLFHKKKTYQ